MLDKNKLKPHKHHGRHGTCMECARGTLAASKYKPRKFKVSFMPNNKEKKSARNILNQMDRLKDLGLTIGNVWMK